MRINARVHVDGRTVTIPINADYVTADIAEIKEYIASELYDILGKNVSDFQILNINDIMYDLQQYSDSY